MSKRFARTDRITQVASISSISTARRWPCCRPLKAVAALWANRGTRIRRLEPKAFRQAARLVLDQHPYRTMGRLRD